MATAPGADLDMCLYEAHVEGYDKFYLVTDGRRSGDLGRQLAKALGLGMDDKMPKMDVKLLNGYLAGRVGRR